MLLMSQKADDDRDIYLVSDRCLEDARRISYKCAVPFPVPVIGVLGSAKRNIVSRRGTKVDNRHVVLIVPCWFLERHTKKSVVGRMWK